MPRAETSFNDAKCRPISASRSARYASQSTVSAEPEPVATVAPPSTPPSVNVVQHLDPELVQSLVSTVTAEVTQQPTTLPLPTGSVTTLVDGAIAAAHSRISSAPVIANYYYISY